MSRTSVLPDSKQRGRPEIGKDGLCNAKRRRTTERCAKPAGWGTDHPGVGACKVHGGATQAAALSAGRAISVTMGAPLDIEPHDALLWCVQVTAGEAAYASGMVAELEREQALEDPETTVIRHGHGEEGGWSSDEVKRGPRDLHIWIRVRQECVERLARYSKMALDAGVDERRVRIAEGLANHLAPVLEAIFKDLQLTPKQRKAAPEIMRSHLLTLEAPAQELIRDGD